MEKNKVKMYKMSTVMREYTIIALGDLVKVLISSWGLKDDAHLSAFVLNNAPCLAWTWVFTSVTQ